MFYRTPAFLIQPITNADTLARMLRETVWLSNIGFLHAGRLWLNDSTSPVHHQEYGVLRIDQGVIDFAIPLHVICTQIESITVSLCSRTRIRRSIQRIAAGGEVVMETGIVIHGEWGRAVAY